MTLEEGTKKMKRRKVKQIFVGLQHLLIVSWNALFPPLLIFELPMTHPSEIGKEMHMIYCFQLCKLAPCF